MKKTKVDDLLSLSENSWKQILRDICDQCDVQAVSIHTHKDPINFGMNLGIAVEEILVDDGFLPFATRVKGFIRLLMDAIEANNFEMYVHPLTSFPASFPLGNEPATVDRVYETGQHSFVKMGIGRSLVRLKLIERL